MAVKNKILLIITGSIAAVKIPDLIGLLKDRGVGVTCVLTKAGAEFITPISLASLTGNKVYSDLFSLVDETEMSHIRLSRENDLIIIAPASADILAKMANGFADDLASTILLAADKQILVAPAMNVRMWENSATQRNIAQLKKDGIKFIGPNKGDLACGEEGFGRMLEPTEIAKEIEEILNTAHNAKGKLLSGRKVLVTSGPTIEAIDPVRYISNRSSGRQGHAIAVSLAESGAEVILVAGPTSLPDPAGVRTIHVESAREMMDACTKSLPVDIAVCAAAVSDWGVSHAASQKIKKKSRRDFTLTFAENPDILATLSKAGRNRPKLVIGFAAETEFVVENARVKMEQKGCDWILANDVSGKKVMGKDKNKVILITKNDEEKWPLLAKEKVAERLTEKIADYLVNPGKLKVVGRL